MNNHLVTLSLSFFPATYTLILTVSRPQYFLFSHLPSKKMLRKKILGSCSYGSHASHWKVTFITVPVAYTNTGILKLRVFMRCKNVKISFLFHLVSRFRQFAILYMLKTQIKFAKWNTESLCTIHHQILYILVDRGSYLPKSIILCAHFDVHWLAEKIEQPIRMLWTRLFIFDL